MQTTAQKQKPIVTSEDYINSLRGRKLKVYLFGELVEDIVEHPLIRPSINAVAETYDLAQREPELATAVSELTGEKVNRFLNIVMNRDVSLRKIWRRNWRELKKKNVNNYQAKLLIISGKFLIRMSKGL